MFKYVKLYTAYIDIKFKKNFIILLLYYMRFIFVINVLHMVI